MTFFSRGGEVVTDPPFAVKLFNSHSPKIAWMWVLLRVWLGYQWLEAGLHKIANPAWMVTGDALKGFWTAAIAIPEAGRPPIAFDWYRTFLTVLLDAQAYTWFAKLIVFGEILVGIALIVGAFVGIAAFFGGLMNFNFMLAGSASTNPLLFLAAVLLILGWKVAGYWGADYLLLHWLGTPWKPQKK